MRVLRLDLRAGALELHPLVTVVRGLAPAARAELVDVLDGVPAGRAPVTGLVEAHGVLLDLSADTLALLDLSDPLPVVVTAADLPGTPTPDTSGLAAARATVRDADVALAAAEAVVAEVEARVESLRGTLAAAGGGEAGDGSARLVVPRATAAAGAARRTEAEAVAERAASAFAAAEQDVLDAEAESVAARERRAGATRALAVAAGALDAATDRLDPVAHAAVEASRQRVAAAEAALAAMRAGGSGTALDAGDDDASIESLRADRLEAEAGVLALATPDPFPVRLALEQVAADAAPVEVAISREAIILADGLAALEVELAALRDRAAAGSGLRAAALQRIKAAQLTVDEVEIRRRPGVEPTAAAILEEAHAEVVAARDAADRRLGGRSARRRLDEAVAAEQKILDRLGFVTYTDFLTGVRSDQDGSVAGSNRLAAARQELAGAEADLRRLDDDAAGELRRAELLQQRVALRAAAVDLLGEDPGADLEAALRRHRVPVGRGSAGADRLAQALEAAGLVIGDEQMPTHFLVDLAKVWLDEQEVVSSQRRSLEARVAELDLRIADRQRTDADPDRATRSSLTNAVADLEDAKATLRSAEARAARHAKAEAEVEERRAAFEAASTDEAATLLAVGTADADVIRKDEVRRRATRNLEMARAELAEAVAAAQQAAQALAVLETQVQAATTDGLDDLEDRLARGEAEAAAARADLTSRARSGARRPCRARPLRGRRRGRGCGRRRAGARGRRERRVVPARPAGRSAGGVLRRVRSARARRRPLRSLRGDGARGARPPRTDGGDRAGRRAHRGPRRSRRGRRSSGPSVPPSSRSAFPSEAAGRGNGGSERRPHAVPSSGTTP